MDIFNILALCGGLAFFLYGMNVLSSGLESLSGGKLEGILKKATSNRVKALVLGMGVTAVIQSSSAVTVMLVGLVNSGIMNLAQTVGVIMGSNVGTTMTAWILTTIGIESDNIFISLLKPESFSPVIALIGIILIMMSKKASRKNLGTIFVGFAVLMYGMDLMKNAVGPLADSPEFSSVLTAFNNPILGVVVGTLFTAIIQSSSASVGILQALSVTGSVSFGMAIPIIMGQNIGTCVSALLSSVGANRNAKRVSVVHIAFNIIGTALSMILFYGLNAVIGFSFIDDAINPVTIALCHTIFNLFTTIVLLPFTKYLVKIAEVIIKDKEKKEEDVFIDERLLNTPSFAISECKNLTVKMAATAKKSVVTALGNLFDYSSSVAKNVNKCEDELDLYEDKLGSFLVKISGKQLGDKDSKKVAMMLHTIGDFERLGDHALNLVDVSKEISDKKLEFSRDAKAQLGTLVVALGEIVNITIDAFSRDDIELAKSVEPLEQVIDQLTTAIKAGHIERLQAGDCTIEMGFVLSDILNNIERVSDHCSNIAVALIETAHGSFDTHKYLNSVKILENQEFKEKYLEYAKKYSL
ncbi:MAG: Na/Pi cotransporter family protein [Oscillospiraceae bacterium]|nr:Na/Pi cotransporter family protein [Oscillospiraceae bacterium]